MMPKAHYLGLFLVSNLSLGSSATSKDVLQSILKEYNEIQTGDVIQPKARRQLQTDDLVCNRFVDGRNRATVCQDDSTFSYCFVDNPDECEYIAIDWNLFEQEKAQYTGPVQGDLDLFIAETFFTCPCDGSIPNCATSTFTAHSINTCREDAANFVSCEVEDNIEKCSGRNDGRSYRCSRPPSATAGVETTTCCTIATALEPRTCVKSVLTFDQNDASSLIACTVDVDGDPCTCSVCGSEAISYDCSAVGRDDLVESCPSTGGAVGIEEFYLGKLDSPLGYIEPLGPVVTQVPSSSPSIRITPMPSTEPSLSESPSLSQMPTMLNTPDPTTSPAPSESPTTSPPTKAPTIMPSSTPSSSPSVTQVPSSSPTNSVPPTSFPTRTPSVTPSLTPSGSPTAPTPGPTATGSEPPTPDFVATCEGIHAQIQAFNEGYGDLECGDYEGTFPGAIFACSVTTSLRNDAVGFDIEPVSSIRQPFSRRCNATAPDGLTLFCLDNVGANFDAFNIETSNTDLGCEASYVFPQYNLLQGVSADTKESNSFDTVLAASAYFVEFLGDPTAPSTSAKGLDSAAPSRNAVFMSCALASSFLSLKKGNCRMLDYSSRTFARSSGTDNPPDVEKAVTFIVNVGYERPIAQGVVDALKEAGMSGDALLATARQLAGRWEVGEDEGLEPLAASVKMTLSKVEGKKTIKVYVVPPNSWNSSEGEEDKDVDYEAMMSRAFEVEALEGTSLTDVAKFGDGEGAETLGEYIECACAGIMACSTCHVIVDEQWFEKVGEPCEAEQDMLDLAYSPRDRSRLGCQIVLDETLDGLVVKIPKGANNLMDFVPFQD
ncbi:MAG: hypothetical protein SGBAC_005589 [Bacillariaceae sp.]